MQIQSPVKLTTRTHRNHLKQGKSDLNVEEKVGATVVGNIILLLPLVAIVPVGRLREESVRISELRLVTKGRATARNE